MNLFDTTIINNNIRRIQEGVDPLMNIRSELDRMEELSDYILEAIKDPSEYVDWQYEIARLGVFARDISDYTGDLLHRIDELEYEEESQ